MFAGFLDQISGNFYGEYFKTPANPQGYTIQVPTGSNYLLLGFIDQNNEGVIDAGDIQNAGSSVVTAISGTTANLDLTLPSANSSATVTTQNLVSTAAAAAVKGSISPGLLRASRPTWAIPTPSPSPTAMARRKTSPPP
jgi:hypothetical protein